MGYRFSQKNKSLPMTGRDFLCQQVTSKLPASYRQIKPAIKPASNQQKYKLSKSRPPRCQYGGGGRPPCANTAAHTQIPINHHISRHLCALLPYHTGPGCARNVRKNPFGLYTKNRAVGDSPPSPTAHYHAFFRYFREQNPVYLILPTVATTYSHTVPSLCRV